jgi:hypothetical protein
MNGARSNRILGTSSKIHTVRQYLPRRVCAVQSCWTVLSIYNGAEFCWLHEAPTRRTGTIVHH